MNKITYMLPKNTLLIMEEVIHIVKAPQCSFKIFVMNGLKRKKERKKVEHLIEKNSSIFFFFF